MAPVKKAGITHWQREAASVLRALLAAHRVTNKRLSHLLAAFGPAEPAKSISNKIARGTFSFAFFLRSMRALGKTEVRFLLTELSSDERAQIAYEAKRQKRRAGPKGKSMNRVEDKKTA
jgi:hypothetical protein